MMFRIASPHLAIFLATLLLLEVTEGQQQQPRGRDRDQFEPLQPESPIFRRRGRTNCNKNFRTLDGTCTNPFGRTRKIWGSVNRPQFSYFGRRMSSTVPTGAGQKSAREISNILFRSTDDVFDPRGLNEMAAFFGQFIDHNLVATPADKASPLPIEVPSDDPVFGNATICGKNIGERAQLRFFRSNRVRVRPNRPQELPQNSLTSALDLCAVYGPNEERNNALRAGAVGGAMAMSKGEMPPLNNGKFNNAPDPSSTKFFLTGDHRANEHPILTALHTVFLREHNSLAAELKTKFPTWDDKTLFETARKINGAQFQKIVFKDWYPSVTGSQLPRYFGFRRRLDISVSTTFSTAAFRVGHTMIGNEVKRKGPGNVDLPSFPVCKMFFNVAELFQTSDTLESFMRGSLGNRAQKVDLKVRNSLRNFLFENVAGEDGFDLVALNIQRGRDHALPSYFRLCSAFGSRVSTFGGISSNPTVQSNLATAYGTVGKIEAWPGMLAEDLKAGSSLPPCIFNIWQFEFRRLRDGDSFYYENGAQFSSAVKSAIPRVAQLYDDKVDTFKAILLRNTGIVESELPPKMFFWK